MIDQLKVLWARLNVFMASVPVQVKAFAIFLGSAILIAKFKDLLIDFLVESSKKLLQKTEAKDQKLSATESAENQEANQLVEKAKQELSNNPQPDEDWYKK